jgi:hypothetical protein
MKKYSPGWEMTGSVLAFPHGWQRPAKTEEWAYELSLANLTKNRFAQLLCFPWATLIDLQRRGKREKAKQYLDALYWTPPKTTLIRATVMQHIYAKDMLPQLARLGITDVFWSHATKNEHQIDGIRIHPFPLYPVCCAEFETNEHWIPLRERKYLYSFIGAYDADLYLTQARQWIFELPPHNDAYIERRDEWHFESDVYHEQVNGKIRTDENLGLKAEQQRHYRNVLGQSIFSLCPSGSGPNTIRLWESIGMGAIPVVLSDQCRLPGEQKLWNQAAIFLRETKANVLNMSAMLNDLATSNEALSSRTENLIALRNKYVSSSAITLLTDFLSVEWKNCVKSLQN